MILQLAIATVMVLATVMMHGLGLAMLGRSMGREMKQERELHFRCVASAIRSH
jgi:uncharacterized protein YhhL (DUF1145 family)